MATRNPHSPTLEGYSTSLLQSPHQSQLRLDNAFVDFSMSTTLISTEKEAKAVTRDSPAGEQESGNQQSSSYSMESHARLGDKPALSRHNLWYDQPRHTTRWVLWALLCAFFVVSAFLTILFVFPSNASQSVSVSVSTVSQANGNEPVVDTSLIGARISFQNEFNKDDNENKNEALQKEKTTLEKPRVKVLEQLMEDAAYLPGVGAPFVDLTAGQRCDIIDAMDGTEQTNASNTLVRVDNRDGVVTVYLTARDSQNSSCTYGGDAFRCTLIQKTNADPGGIVGRRFRAFSYSYDHCNGTYTCTFDMRHGAAGSYNVALVHLSRMYTHMMRLVEAPSCGAAVASRYINATKLLDVGKLVTQEIAFSNATVDVSPQPLSTNHLPPCTMASPSAGRWVAQTVCFPGQKVDPARNESLAGGCRLGDAGMRVFDASVWVPFSCSLRYVSPSQFAQKALKMGHRRVTFLGDSRSYNFFLSFVQFMHGARPNPVTGTFNQTDLATNMPFQKPRIFTNDTLSIFDLSYTAHNMTFELFTSFGTADHMDQFPCPEIPEIVTNTYHSLKRTIGTWFEKFRILTSSPPDEQPDVIILQDGGLHESFMSFTEMHYVHSVRKIIDILKANFPNKKIIYFTLPAAMVRDFEMGFSVRSEYLQWRRAQLGRKLFSEAGYDVWDIHHMTASRADRYFDAIHYYPQEKYRTKWHEQPMLLAHELVQDLVNRMYEWP